MVRKFFYEFVYFVAIVSTTILVFLFYFKDYFFSNPPIVYDYVEYDRSTLIVYFSFLPILLFGCFGVYLIRMLHQKFKNSIVNFLFVIINILIIAGLVFVNSCRLNIEMLALYGEAFWADYKTIFDISIYSVVLFVLVLVFSLNKILLNTRKTLINR